MPAIPWVIGLLGVGSLMGFTISEEVGKSIKWVAIAGVVYLVAKKVKK